MSDEPKTLQEHIALLQRNVTILADWTQRFEAHDLKTMHVSAVNLSIEFASTEGDAVVSHFKRLGFDAWNRDTALSRSIFLIVEGVTVRIWGRSE